MENKAGCLTVVQWLLLFFILGSCKPLAMMRPEPVVEEPEEVCEEESSPDDYYELLRAAERKHFHDSCELVLQAEWDSMMRTLSPEVTFVDLLADSIIEFAKTLKGIPYRSGGNGPQKFDCSGFTMYVFRHFGYELKRTVIGQLRDGWKTIDDPNDLRKGDLVFYGSRKDPKLMGHVGIVIDNDVENHRFTFIHAAVKTGITISTSTEKYYRLRYLTACRILPEL